MAGSMWDRGAEDGTALETLGIVPGVWLEFQTSHAPRGESFKAIGEVMQGGEHVQSDLVFGESVYLRRTVGPLL